MGVFLPINEQSVLIGSIPKERRVSMASGMHQAPSPTRSTTAGDGHLTDRSTSASWGGGALRPVRGGSGGGGRGGLKGADFAARVAQQPEVRLHGTPTPTRPSALVYLPAVA
jgi:hypothetical protein